MRRQVRPSFYIFFFFFFFWIKYIRRLDTLLRRLLIYFYDHKRTITLRFSPILMGQVNNTADISPAQQTSGCDSCGPSLPQNIATLRMYDFRLLDSVEQTLLFALLCLCNDVTFRSKFKSRTCTSVLRCNNKSACNTHKPPESEPWQYSCFSLFLVSNVILIIVKEQ